MNKYTQEIQDLFYNKHPELKKLEFGCEVMIYTEENRGEEMDLMNKELDLEKFKVVYFRGYRSTGELPGTDEGELVMVNAEEKFPVCEFDYTADPEEILGKPITTLQAVSLLGNRYDGQVSHTGQLYITEVDPKLGTPEESEHISIYKTIRIDPTLPLLRDQDPEVIKQLWELIFKE